MYAEGIIIIYPRMMRELIYCSGNILVKSRNFSLKGEIIEDAFIFFFYNLRVLTTTFSNEQCGNCM